MPRSTVPEAARVKLIRLVGDGVSVRAASRAVGIPSTTAHRIIAGTDLPWSGQPQPNANPPPNAWSADQPIVPPQNPKPRPGYNDRTFKATYAPIAFDGWSLERIRRAISLHRQGFFYESSVLAISVLSFPPILAALQQRIAPILALPRSIDAGERGLSRVLGEEIAKQIVPRDGLASSPYFPSTNWGVTAINLAMMGFSAFQHVLGEFDEETETFPLYTRPWPTWAMTFYRYRETFVANTDAGPVDMINDGKFTIVADNPEPHLMAAICALGEEAYSGIAAQRARGQYIDRYGDPKLVAEMPPMVQTHSDEGDAMFAAMQTIVGPDGVGVVPNGAKVTWQSLQAQASTVFSDAIASVVMFSAMALTGSDGTVSGGTSGVYTSPVYEGIKRTLVDRDLKSTTRGVNEGHVATYLRFNYSASIAAASGWKEPVLSIPLPDPDADARMKSYAEREASLVKIIADRRGQGFVVTEEDIAEIARRLDVRVPTLPKGTKMLTPTITDKDVEAKEVAPDEVRAQRGLAPLPEGAGTVEQLAKERLDGRDRTGGSGKSTEATGWGGGAGSPAPSADSA